MKHIVIIIALIAFNTTLLAQSTISSITALPELEVCSSSEFSCITNTLSSGISTPVMEIDLPVGVEYKSGTAEYKINAGSYVSINPSTGTTKFSLPQLNLGDQVSFKYKAEAISCSAIGSQPTGTHNWIVKLLDNTTEVFTTYDGSAWPTFNINYPSLLLSSQETSVTAIKGQTISNKLEVTNIGTAATGDMELQIVVPYETTAGDLLAEPTITISKNGSNKLLANPTVNSNSQSNEATYTYTISTTDLSLLGYPSGLPEYGSFTITDETEYSGCFTLTEYVLEKKYSIFWGCNSPLEPCSLNNSTAHTALLNHLQSDETANLAITPSQSVFPSYGANGTRTYTLTNNGESTLTNMILELYQSTFVDIASVTKDGNTISEVSTNPWKYEVGELNPGESTQLDVEYNINCETNCGGITRYLHANVFYDGSCNTNYMVSDRIEDVEEITSAHTSGEVDLVEGVQKTFTFTPNVSLGQKNFTPACSESDPYSVKVTLPANITYASGTATYIEPGQSLQTITASVNGNILTLTGFTLANNNIVNGEFSIDLELSSPCPTAPANGFKSISWELLYDCYGSCTRSLGCASWEYFAHYNACGGNPDPSIEGTAGCSIKSTGFTTQRATFGFEAGASLWTDNTAPSTLATAATSGVKLDAAYRCDEIDVEVTGDLDVSGSNPACTATPGDFKVYVTYKPPVNDDAILTYVGGAEFDFLNASNQTGSAPTITWDSNNEVYLFVFSLPSVSLLTGQVTFRCKFKVDNDAAIPDNYFLKRFRGEWRKEPASTFGPNTWGEIFHIYNPEITLSHNAVGSNFLCGQTREIKLTVEGGDGDDFPNELREVAAFDGNIVYNLPKGYTYVATTCSLSVDGNNSIAVAPATSGTAEDGITLTWTSNNNWLHTDKGAQKTELILTFDVESDCQEEYLGVDPDPFSGNVHVEKVSYSSSCNTTTEEGLNNLPDPRTTPNLIISPLPIVYGANNEADYTFQLTNNGVATDNVWIAFEITSGIEIDDVLEDDVSILPGTPDYYGTIPSNHEKLYLQLGSMAASETKNFKLNLIFTDCEKTTAGSNSLDFYTGWSCDGYPGAPSVTFHSDPLTVSNTCNPVKSTYTINSKSPVLLTQLKSPLAAVGNMCDDDAQVVIKLKNAGNAVVKYRAIDLNLPAGLSFDGTADWEHFNIQGVSQSSGSLSSLSNPWNLSTAVTSLEIGESIELTFDVEISCTYELLSTFQVISGGENDCTPASIIPSGFVVSSVPISGLEEIENLNLGVAATPFTGVTGTSDVTVILGNATAQTFTGVTVTITVDGEVSFDGVLPTTPETPVPNYTSGSPFTLEFNTPFDVPPGGRTFKFSLKDYSDYCEGGTASIHAKASIDKVLSCAGGGNDCNVDIDNIANGVTQVNLPSITNGCPPPPPCEECIGSFAPETDKIYIISAWARESEFDNALTYSNPYVELYFEGNVNPNDQEKEFYPSGMIIDEWQRIYGTFSIPQGTAAIHVKLKNKSSSEDAFFDDVRIHPFNSNMKSFVYDPVTLRLAAELDDNNYATFYEYDQEGKLIRVKKETELGIQTIQESRNSYPKVN